MSEQQLPYDLEETPPGPQLAGVLAGADRKLLDDRDRVRLLQARHRMIAHLQGEFYTDLYSMTWDEPPQEEGLARGVDDDMYPWATTEVALALTWTKLAASVRLDHARRLIEDLPAVRTYLSEGLIDVPKALVILDGVLPLELDMARPIVDEVLKKAPQLTTGQLRVWLRRLVMAADPAAAKRHAKTRIKGRRVNAILHDSNLAEMAGFDLAPHRVAASWERLNAVARAAKASGDPRSMDELRADVLLDLLIGEGIAVGGPITDGSFDPPPDPDHPDPDHPDSQNHGDDGGRPDAQADGRADAQPGETTRDSTDGEDTDGEDTDGDDTDGDDADVDRASGDDVGETPADRAAEPGANDDTDTDDTGVTDVSVDDADGTAAERAGEPTTTATADATTTAAAGGGGGAPATDPLQDPILQMMLRRPSRVWPRQAEPAWGTTWPVAPSDPALLDPDADPPADLPADTDTSGLPPPAEPPEADLPADTDTSGLPPPAEPPEQDTRAGPHGDAEHDRLRPFWLAGFNQLPTTRPEGCPHCGHRPGTGKTGVMPSPRRGVLELHMSLFTLLGYDNLPAELAGFGPVLADIARQVARDRPDLAWKFNLYHQGELLTRIGTKLRPPTIPHGPGDGGGGKRTSRRPTTEVAEFVRARNRTCVRPGCRRHSRTAEIDHTIAVEHHGKTEPNNLGPACTCDHHFKHSPGCQLIQSTTGGRFGWITPKGMRYIKTPDPPLYDDLDIIDP